MHDNFDYKGFLQKNRLGPYAKTGKLNEGFDMGAMEKKEELNKIEDMVDSVFEQDSLTQDSEIENLKNMIQDAWRNEGSGDVYEFTKEYLMDWASEERSKQFKGNEEPSVGTEQNSIWGDNWQNVISRATQKPEPGDDFYSQDKGGSSKAANWQGRTNPALEEELDENAQEDEDGDQVTKGQIYPEPIEVVSMGSNGAVIKVRKPNGEEEDVEFELGPEIEEVDPPYGYEGTIYGEIDGEEYGIAVSLVDMGGAGYDMDLSYDGLTFLEEGPSNQQEDEDGDQVYEDEVKGSGDNGYETFLRALTPIINLVKKGIITEEEKDKIINACVPIFTRLKGDQ